MRLRLNSLLLLVYLAILSLVLKKFLLLPLILAAIIFLAGKYINSELENLVSLAIAMLPFIPLFAIFLFYLPFAVYGWFLGHSNFTKKYIFGYAMSFFSAILLYILSVLGVKLNYWIIFIVFFLPVVIILARLYLKSKNFTFIKEIYRIDAKEFAAILISLFFMFFVVHNIINNSNMYMSNGTYVYTKYLSVVESVKKTGFVPQYDPRIAQGEHLFYTDTAVFYSNLGFASLILAFIPTILFFNSITVFIIWLSILALWLFIRELLPEKDDYFSHILPVAASLSVVLSFMFIQLFESFKQSSAYPVNFFILALIFSFPRQQRILLAILSLLILSFLIHGTQFIGFGQLAFFSFLMLLLINSPKERFFEVIGYSKRNKRKIFGFIFLGMLILSIPQFYSVPGQLYKSYMRVPFSLKTEADFEMTKIIVSGYLFKDLFLDKNTNPLSVKYPNLRRIDEKKFGLFFSFFGIICFFFVLINFRKNSFGKAAAFSLAYLIHFVLSSFLVVITFFSSIEYGYRTVLPFMLVLFLASIAITIYSIPSKMLRMALLAVLFAAFIHASFYVKQNLQNIHSESIISGTTFSNEINLVRQLPQDGRFITYGMYSNAVDMAMAALTNRYFSRFGFLQWDFDEDNLYMKIHGLNSFGETERIERYSPAQFANYLRLGGYRYVFLNACHPAGAAAFNKLISGSFPIYQNPNYKCHIFLAINNTNYAEKVQLVEQANESNYDEKNGYKYVSISKNKKLYDFSGKYGPFVRSPKIPDSLAFERHGFEAVRIYGDFNDGEWVVFKEEYFPRWKAYMNGKEVPIVASSHRMMLIKAQEGNEITLLYEMQPKEKLASIVSLAAILMLFAVFVLVI